MNHFFQLPAFLSRSVMTYDTTVSLDNLTFTNYVNFWQMPRQIWTVFLVKKGFQLLGCKIQSFQER